MSITNKLNFLIIISILLILLGYVYLLKNEKNELELPKDDQETSSIESETPKEFMGEPVFVDKTLTLAPHFEKWPKVRNVEDNTLGKTLQDIDSHLPAGHLYVDHNKITWAHETTHGINSEIRMNHLDKVRFNGFYCLQDRACIIYEPKTTIQAVASRIPKILQGPSYQLYLMESGWNDTPLYLFDEWIAYTNGSETGRELNYEGWNYELLQAHNFNVYCICLAQTVKETCPDYDDTQLKTFMKWNIRRTFQLLEPIENNKEVMVAEPEEVKHVPNKHLHKHEVFRGQESNLAESYIEVVRSHPEAEDFRSFARQYLGLEWCKRIYGF